MDTIAKLVDDLKALLTRAQAMNADGETTRSRQLSLAITKIEEAGHWLSEVDEVPF